MKKINQDYVYSRVGMALISAQRVEFVSGQILELLVTYDKNIYGITTDEFLEITKLSGKKRKTLGNVFMLLKLNPKLFIEDELNEYLKKRNNLVHKFWKSYLNNYSLIQAKKAIEFCYDFGRLSDKVESYFKGFLYFLALRHSKDREHLEPSFKKMEKDFEYFMQKLKSKE